MCKEQCLNCGRDWDWEPQKDHGACKLCKSKSVCSCGWCALCDEIVQSPKSEPMSKRIANVGILVDPTRPARLVFSFTMARGTEKSKESFDEYVDTVLRTVNDAVMKIGHGSDGRFEALIAGGEIVD